MSDRPADATDAELAVLRHLWDHGTRTRRQLTDAVYPGGGPAHYTTVQKLLERLEAKGLVAAVPGEGVRRFSAAVERDALIRTRLRDVADKLCDGSVAPLLMNLVGTGTVSEADLAELRALVRKLSKPSHKKGG
ncbi:MAG TPA: BlaI/MecI/CopY family transcriptional regulator [Fimbriiglobus sp.]|jgi:predicted transcriptional regulator